MYDPPILKFEQAGAPPLHARTQSRACAEPLSPVLVAGERWRYGYKKWVDHAVLLGCPRVMINQGTLAPDVRQAAVDTLKTINPYAKSKKVFITMENRGAGGGRGGRAGAGAAGSPPTADATVAPTPPRTPSATWEVVVEVIQASGIYANPDVGNLPDEESRSQDCASCIRCRRAN